MPFNHLSIEALLSFLMISFLVSCNSRAAESHSVDLLTSAREIFPSKDTLDLGVPRKDSVLQFSVMITSIFEDSKGNFWFGSHGDGLCKYDGKQYTYFTANHGLPSGKIREFAPGPDWDKTRNIDGGNQIGAIEEDHNGNIWISTLDHISKFDGNTFNPVQVEKEGTLRVDWSDEEWLKEFNHLWFGFSKSVGVHRYNGETLEFLTLPLSYKTKGDGVSVVYKDNDGNMWFGTMGNGTFRYDGKSFTRINLAHELGICRSVYQDKSGRVWITNNSFGLNYFEDGKLKDFIKEYSIENNDPLIVEEFKTGFQSIEQDENGELWFGTFANGLWRYDGEKLMHYTEEDKLNIVTSKTIYKDKRGKLWYGLNEGSVYGFDGATFYRFDGSIPAN